MFENFWIIVTTKDFQINLRYHIRLPNLLASGPFGGKNAKIFYDPTVFISGSDSARDICFLFRSTIINLSNRKIRTRAMFNSDAYRFSSSYSLTYAWFGNVRRNFLFFFIALPSSIYKTDLWAIFVETFRLMITLIIRSRALFFIRGGTLNNVWLVICDDFEQFYRSSLI